MTNMKIFRPTLNNFENFREYVHDISKNCQNDEMVKIIPPQQWLYNMKNSMNNDFKQIKFDKMIKQTFSNLDEIDNNFIKINSKQFNTTQSWNFDNNNGLVGANLFDNQTLNDQLNTNFDNFNKLICKNDRNNNNDNNNNSNKNLWNDYYISDDKSYLDNLENEYWSSIKDTNNVLEGIKDNKDEINSLNNLLNFNKKETASNHQDKSKIISDTLILNVFGTSNSWKIKEMDELEIIFLHSGSPRIWYSVSGKNKEKLQNLIEKRLNTGNGFYALDNEIDGSTPNSNLNSFDSIDCSQILNENSIMVAPEMLKSFDIDYDCIVQDENEIIVIFPSSCYSSVDLNLNLMESLKIQANNCDSFTNTEENFSKNPIFSSQTEFDSIADNILFDLESTKFPNDCIFEFDSIGTSSTGTDSTTYFKREPLMTDMNKMNKIIDNNQNERNDTDNNNDNGISLAQLKANSMEPSSYLESLNYDVVGNNNNITTANYVEKLSNSAIKEEPKLETIERKDTETDEKMVMDIAGGNSSFLLPTVSSPLDYSNPFDTKNNFPNIEDSINDTKVVQNDNFLTDPPTLPTDIDTTTIPTKTFLSTGSNSINMIDKNIVTNFGASDNNYIYSGGNHFGSKDLNDTRYANSVLPKVMSEINSIYKGEISSLELVRTDDLINRERREEIEQYSDIRNGIFTGRSGTRNSTKFRPEEIIRTENGKTYKCCICNRQFSSGHHLTRHKKCVHSNLKPYPCPKCDKRFKRKDHVMQHLQKKQTCKPV